MRGFLQPSVKPTLSDSQKTFGALPRGRRVKLAKAAQTTLVKADQWANGGRATTDVAEALEAQLKSLLSKKKKHA
jgi:hypothetical protein